MCPTTQGNSSLGAGRNPQPSARILDTQSVKTTSVGGVRGYDGAKNLSGRRRKLAISRAEIRELSQHSPSLRCLYPATSKLRILLLLFNTNKETPKLLCGYPTRPRSTEWVEDEVALSTRCHYGTADEAQRLLGGMISMELLPPWYGRDVPEGGDLGSRV